MAAGYGTYDGTAAARFSVLSVEAGRRRWGAAWKCACGCAGALILRTLAQPTIWVSLARWMNQTGVAVQRPAGVHPMAVAQRSDDTPDGWHRCRGNSHAAENQTDDAKVSKVPR